MPKRRSAARAYAAFTGRAAARAKKVRLHVPRRVWLMGQLEALDYSAVKPHVGVIPFRHRFARGSRAILATDGKHLYILGGRFHVTERGIVDLSPSGRERE